MKIFPNGQSIAHRKVVKWGIDPTGSRLHIGHFVAIRFLRKMLAEHRDVVVVIGRRTAQVGDPSGSTKERPVLDPVIIRANAEVLASEIRKLLPAARVVFNDQHPWTVDDLLRFAGKLTTTALQDRHAFGGRSVRANELLVPVLQAMDSIALGAEVEIGGEDQEFNFAITRDLQGQFGFEPEVCVMFPIIRGTDGQKMSKSLGNCVFMDDPDIRGRILSIPDDVMDEWFPLFCDEEPKEHPFERKKQLADEIIKTLLA